MRKIVAATFLTLDGVMQAPGGPEEDPSGGFRFGGWQAGSWEEDVGAAIDETFREGFDLLLGRRTYDIFAAHWPFVPTDPSAPGYDPGMAEIAVAFKRVTKYVATHRPDSLTWENTEWLGPDPVAKLAAIKAGDGPMLLIQGSSVLIQELLAADLIDDVRLMIAPLVLGGGKRLFGDGTLPRTLRLVTSRTTPGGTILARYERAGEVKTASFALETPTDAEVARRKAL
jgi:dihydrofolate reductase